MDTPLTQNDRLLMTWLGGDVEYPAGMAVMRQAMEEVERAPKGPARLLLLEHAETISVTRQGGLAHLKVTPEDLADAGITLLETDRGGDVTFHGPGQLVGYPVVKLRQAEDDRVDLLGYLRALEDGLVAACRALGVLGAHRKPGMTGVWVASIPGAPENTWAHDDGAAKLIALGVGVRRGVTRHGFALNVTTDLERFTTRIVPCGLTGRPVTSLARLLEEGRLACTALPDAHALREHISAHVSRALALPLARDPQEDPDGANPADPDGPFAHRDKDGAFHG